jgi:hypothetical protein
MQGATDEEIQRWSAALNQQLNWQFWRELSEDRRRIDLIDAAPRVYAPTLFFDEYWWSAGAGDVMRRLVPHAVIRDDLPMVSARVHLREPGRERARFCMEFMAQHSAEVS